MSTPQADRFGVRTAAALVLLTALAAGQVAGDGPYWFTTPTPANFVSLQGLGSTIYVRTTTDVQFFSGFTRTWTVIPVANPTVNVFNDYAIVRDGNTVYGYSTRTGTAATLSVSSSAIVTNGPLSASWVCVVRDGFDCWGFAPFIGVWSHQSVNNSTTSVVAGAYVAVVHDGLDAYAFGGIDGVWASTPAAGASMAAGGLLAAVYDATSVRCFSARWSTWETYAMAGASSPVFKDELGYFAVPGTVLAFSALTNHFAAINHSGTGIAQSGRASLVVADGTTIYCYAPGTDAVVPVVCNASPALVVNAEYAVVDDSGIVTAFSALTGRVSAPIVGAFGYIQNEDVCFATSAAGSFAYSAILGEWTAAPAVTALQFHTVRNAVILATSSGYHAYSARYGQWNFLPAATPNTVLNSTLGATFVAIDGATVSAFDSRLGRWHSQTMSAPYAAGSVWRMTAVVNDGADLYGFSQLNDVWDATPFSAPTLQFAANDSIAWARDAANIYVYASNATFSTVSRYAEFTRMQARGTPLRLVQQAPPGSYVECAVSAGPGFIPIPPYGVVTIDPALLVGIVPLGFTDATGRLDVSFTLPTDPGFNGVQLFLQNVVTTPAPQLFVSNAVTPIVI